MAIKFDNNDKWIHNKQTTKKHKKKIAWITNDDDDANFIFLLVVLSCTHKQAHIVHINTYPRKMIKKQKHMDIKKKVTNTTHVLEKTTFTWIEKIMMVT
jgi:hypothetical protein